MSIGAPLTITLSLDGFPPLETHAAVISAYNRYRKRKICGPDLARQVQDAMAVYNNEQHDDHGAPPITDPNDRQFRTWAAHNYPDYGKAEQGCIFDAVLYISIEDDAAHDLLTRTPTETASSDSVSIGSATSTSQSISNTTQSSTESSATPTQSPIVSQLTPTSSPAAQSNPIPSTNGGSALHCGVQGTLWLMGASLIYQMI